MLWCEHVSTLDDVLYSGSENFISCIRNGLKRDFPGKFIGLGGVFVMKTGKLNAHVMPDFPKVASLALSLTTEEI
jgi:hypothetical protein